MLISTNSQQAPQVVPGNEELLNELDPFVIGRKKLSEFWKVYVKEADAFDKELSDGWNKFSTCSFFIIITAILLFCVVLQNVGCNIE